MNPTSPLPIDPLLPEILQALEKHNAAVVVAEPGAGKTTRVPPALLSSAFAKDKEIWVLQPRRLAAKLAALRVAQELGEEPGKNVGYQFRFEKRLGPETRLRFMTDGMLLPLAQADPKLSKVAAVVLDEFHERSLALELGLAYLRSLQMGARPDLRILVMSATLDSESLSSFLSNCPVLKSSGRVFPVNVEFLPLPEQPDLSLKVKSAVRHLSAQGLKGTTLVFLPGLAEIKRCQAALAQEQMEVHALYGDLPVEEQQRVLSPTEGRKVILATNVAETSLTVPGVTAVIDSGLTRQARVSPWSGLESLVTLSASQASAAQRTGRAGRLQEGTCLRLYTKFDFEHRAAFDLPELLRADLTKSVLDLKCLGVENLGTFPWFLKPPPGSLESAQVLLTRLGALDKAGLLTAIGKRMARFPIVPRLAKFLIEVEELAPANSKLIEQACRLAVLINEEKAGSEDLLEELSRFKPGYESNKLEEQLESLLRTGPHRPSPLAGEGQGEGYDVTLQSRHHPHPSPLPSRERGKNHDTENILAKALLTAFPDRVGRVRVSEGSEARNKSGRVRELLLSTGGTLLANDGSLTREHEYFVVVEAQETTYAGKTQVKVRSMCPIEVDWLLDNFSGTSPEALAKGDDVLYEEQTFQWNDKAGRVEGFQRLKYGQLVLEEKSLAPKDFGPEAQALLLKEALSAGTQSYCDPEELEAFLNRVKFVSGRTKAFKEFSTEMVQETLRELCQGYRSLEDLKTAGLVPALRAKLEPKDQALLERLAPSSILLPSGRRISIHYDPGKPPWSESRLQDFFGMNKGPAVGGGEVPVVLHFLSPGKKRAVQVTSDLSGFWKNHYPQVRKEFMRKYPRHKWPENPV